MRKNQSERELFDQQYAMIEFSMNPKNPLFAELKAIDQLLDEMPEILDLVRDDIGRCENKKGRPAVISSEQILRSAILMQLRRLPYRDLQEEIDMNPTYRKFTRFYRRKIPHYAQLNNLIKKISDKTMQQINDQIVKLARKKKVENGKSSRLDTTVSETNIMYPVDARLLLDCCRVLNRTLEKLRESAPELKFAFRNHSRVAKKTAYQIVLLKGKNAAKNRIVYYQKLLRAQKKTRGYAANALAMIEAHPEVANRLEIMTLRAELQTCLGLAEKVYDQCDRRVNKAENVPASEKLVSIFEPHTDIICRGKKGAKTEFGHKINFATGRSGLITHYAVLEGNPCDGETLEPALDHHIELFGCAPAKIATDRRYYSEKNEKMATSKGVKQVALPKPGRLSIVRKELQKQKWFKELLRWRGGIEGCLSTLLRRFGLKRCIWKGWKSFKSYVGFSVVTYNLRLLAGYGCHG